MRGGKIGASQMLTQEQRAEILAGATTTVPLAGKVLGVGLSRAYQSARIGEIPTVRLGRKMVVPVPKLREMLGLPAHPLAADTSPIAA
jgi:hypothetical protein